MSAPSDIGAPPELAWLPVDKLDVDPAYQRTLDTKASQKLIQKIADEFDWRKFGALIATPKPKDADRWLIIDGQHRSAGAKRRGDILHLPAVVHRDLDLAGQAQAFLGANRDRVPISAQALFHARLLAGDHDCIVIARACKKAGVELLRYPLSVAKTPAGKTAAIPALFTVLRKYGEAITEETIAAVAGCFGQLPGGLRAPVFLAAAQALSAGCDRAALQRGLSLLGLDHIERSGSGLGGFTKINAITAAITKAAARQDAILSSFAVPDRRRLMAGR